MYKIRQLLSCVLFCVLVFAMLRGNSICSYASETPTEEIELTVENSYYLHENSNVDTIHALTEGALPCIGEARILVFFVDFKGGETNWPCTAEYVNDMFFSEEGKYNSSIAYSEEDSLRSYYYRSSYGKVDITGTVYEYETQYDTSYYTDVGMALDEVIDYYRETINWDDYDGNNDGYIDGIYLIARNRHSFGGPNFVGVYENEVSNKKICKACFLDTFDFQTMCHETCHMFGPPDMYAGVGVNPSGIQTVSVMENGFGDLPSPTKFVLGWLDNVRFIDVNSVGDYELGSYSNCSDVLIVYPNGDVTNRNWFFIEYVTGEGNNLQGGNGLRIWKTQMNLDDNYNISGATEFCSGMSNSPYEYLEAIHPDGEYNYYMTEGEIISPYTYPSTSYSDTFYMAGDAKFLKDLTFSGIEVGLNKVQDNVAKVTVNISEAPDDGKEAFLEVNIHTPDTSSVFLDSSEKFHIATISASMEIKASGEAKMISSDETKSIPLTCELSKNNKSLYIYIDKHYLIAENMASYNIVLPDVVTYYGKSIQTSQILDCIDLPMVPVSYDTLEEIYSTDFSMTFEYDLTCFKVSDEKILTIFLDDVSNKLFWGEFDLNLNSTVKYELESPEQLEISGTNETISVWEDRGYYYVYINGFICCYQNKELVCFLDTATLADSFRFCGGNQNSYFVSSEGKELYHLVKQENELILEKVPFINEHVDEILSQTMINNLDNSLYGALKEVHCLREDRYIINTDSVLYLVKESNIEQYDISEQLTEHNLNRRAVEVVEDKIYVFDCGNELLRYEFDLDFNLIEKKVLLYKLDETLWGPFTLNVEFIDDIWLVAMESVSNSNAISYASTFIITFDKNGSVINYYRYGDESERYVCQVVPINKDIMVCVKAFSFFYISRPNEHFYSVWESDSDEQHKRTCECGDIQYARHIWNANGGGKCSVCGMQSELPDIGNAIVEVSGTYVFNGEAQIPDKENVVVTVDGEVVPSDQYTIDAVNCYNAGWATVRATAVEGGSYVGITGLETGKYFIEQSQPTITFGTSYSLDKEYNGRIKENPQDTDLVLRGVTYDEVEFVWYEGEAPNGIALEGEPVNAGNYYLEVSFTGDSNRKAVKVVSEPIVISKGIPVEDMFIFTPPSVLLYDGEEKNATIETKSVYEDAEIFGMGEVALYYYDVNNSLLPSAPDSVGTYMVKIMVAEGVNYEASSVELADSTWKFTIEGILVSNVELNVSLLSLYSAETYNLTAAVSPSDASNKNVIWETDNPAVATVDDTGKVTAVTSGSATITVKTTDGSGVSASCEVTVTQPVVEDPVEAFVTRMYQQCLSREPDASGLDGWVGQLKGGYMNGAQIAEQFVFSNEMLSKNLSDEEFVNVLYRAMMGREADESGSAGWVNQLSNGYMTRSEVTKSFVDSPEFTGICDSYGIIRGDYDASIAPIEHFVTRFYTLCLEREPDQEGLYGWVDNLKKQYMNGAQIAEQFFFSDEFIARNVSDEKYIELLYNTLMGRPSDENGKAGWRGQLQNGYMTRRDMMKAFIESTEFTGICESYGIIRGTIE